MFTKKKLFILLMSFVILLFSFTACDKRESAFKKGGGKSYAVKDGWINNDTYQVTVIGLWDRSRYYLEGADSVRGKEPKSEFGLQEDSKLAAKVKAMREFREKLGAYITSTSEVKDGKLASDLIKSKVEGGTIVPQLMKETYSANNDCRAVYQFKAKGLKKLIDKLGKESLVELE